MHTCWHMRRQTAQTHTCSRKENVYCAQTGTGTFMHAHRSTYGHTYLHTHVLVYMRTYEHVACVYIRTCRQIYIHTYIHTCMHACVGTCTSTLIQQERVSDNFYRIRTLPRLWPFQFPFNIAMGRECLVQKMNRSTAEKVTRF